MQPPSAGWSTVKLGDIGDALIGLTFDPDSVRRAGTLVLRSSNIQDGALAFDDNVYVDCSIPDRIRVRDGDILICVRNGSRRLIGKSAMLDERVVGETFGAFMAVFRSEHNHYLRYFFQSGAFKRQIDGHLGATINQITNASLKSFTVALPGTPERIAIAARLSDTDDLIASLERLIIKREAIKTGMMQQLLTGNTRLPGFTAPWQVMRFEALASPAKERANPAKLPTDTPLIELEQIDGGGGQILAYGTAQDAVSMKTVFRPDDVLFGRLRAYLRKFWLADRAGICSTEIWALRSTRAAIGPYVRYLVETKSFIEVASGGYGTHMPRADWSLLRNLEFEVPPVSEQQAIASVILDADREIILLRARLAKARAIKEGTMQELLTGRTRLVVEKAAA